MSHSKHIHGDLAARFWPKVDKSPGHGPQGECWLWTGGLAGRDYKKPGGGYGKINDGTGRAVSSHRVAYFLRHGEWPKLPLLHSCDVRACVNHAHLSQGTLADNNEDMRQKGRKYSKLTSEQAAGIRTAMLAAPVRARNQGIAQSLADKFNISLALVYHIKTGRAWSR